MTKCAALDTPSVIRWGSPRARAPQARQYVWAFLGRTGRDGTMIAMTDAILEPSYWLVHGLPWPDGHAPMQEGAYAIAPTIFRRDLLPPDAARILAVADAFHAESRARAIFFSDLTRWLDARGSDWASLDTDGEGGLAFCDELPGLFLTISQRAQAIICDASREGLTMYYPGGRSEKITPEERQVVHDVIEQRLVADWPPYARSLTRAT